LRYDLRAPRSDGFPRGASFSDHSLSNAWRTIQESNMNRVEDLRHPMKLLAQRTPSDTLCKRRRVNRQLTPAKIGVAWEKVRRVVRDLCRQRGPECHLCRLYGGCIEFQLTADYQPIVLTLEKNQIRATIMGKQRNIRIVRIKTGGSGYELRRKIHTATKMLIELLLEARQ
jgi:hypothetical protein